MLTLGQVLSVLEVVAGQAGLIWIVVSLYRRSRPVKPRWVYDPSLSRFLEDTPENRKMIVLEFDTITPGWPVLSEDGL